MEEGVNEGAWGGKGCLVRCWRWCGLSGVPELVRAFPWLHGVLLGAHHKQLKFRSFPTKKKSSYSRVPAWVLVGMCLSSRYVQVGTCIVVRDGTMFIEY